MKKTQAQAPLLSGLVPGLLLAGIILCAGTFSGDILRGKWQAAVSTAIPVQALRDEPTQKRVTELLGHYLSAYLDAVIRFDDVPKFDFGTVTALAEALPEDTEILKMEFLGQRLRIRYTGGETAAGGMLHRLDAGGHFSAVRMEGGGTDENGTPWRSVLCTPRTERGELSLKPLE